MPRVRSRFRNASVTRSVIAIDAFTTTNAVEQVAFTYSVPQNQSGSVSLGVNAFKNDFSANITGQDSFGFLRATGSCTVSNERLDLRLMSILGLSQPVRVVATATGFEIRVKGVAATTIIWNITLTVETNT